MKYVFSHYDDEDNKRPGILGQGLGYAPRCYKDEIEMIFFQSKVDSFPSLEYADEC